MKWEEIRERFESGMIPPRGKGIGWILGGMQQAIRDILTKLAEEEKDED